MIYGFYAVKDKMPNGSKEEKETMHLIRVASVKKKKPNVFICIPHTDDKDLNDQRLNRAWSYILGCYMVPRAALDENVTQPRTCNEPVWNLGWAIRILSQCNSVYFGEGYENDPGCCVIHDICLEFKIPILAFENELVSI